MPFAVSAARDVGVAARDAVHEAHGLEERESTVNLGGRRSSALPVESLQYVVGARRPVFGEQELEHLPAVLGEPFPSASANRLGPGQTFRNARIVVVSPRREERRIARHHDVLHWWQGRLQEQFTLPRHRLRFVVVRGSRESRE